MEQYNMLLKLDCHMSSDSELLHNEAQPRAKKDRARFHVSGCIGYVFDPARVCWHWRQVALSTRVRVPREPMGRSDMVRCGGLLTNHSEASTGHVLGSPF